MRFAVYQLSRKGGRAKNEDRMGYCYTRDSGLFALADGMGGHPEGEVAAQMALQTLAAQFQSQARTQLADPAQYLRDGCLLAHQQLLRYAADKGLSDTPRTTAVACVLQGNNAWWAHCGDSRLYVVRNGSLLARTRDHSYSELRESLAHVMPMGEKVNRNVLFTCLGSPGRPMVDVTGPVRLQRGDRILMCSDGLWSPVSDAEITETLGRLPIAEAVPSLVDRALRLAGTHSDNVTVLSVEWEAAEDLEVPPVATETIGNEVFASTIQASLAAEGAAVDLDEEEIERSIREINEAIQRSNRKASARGQ